LVRARVHQGDPASSWPERRGSATGFAADLRVQPEAFDALARWF
jgi:hypothetical protein